ncbi:MAG: efflux RND transporter periplasmic adaptor subunit [Planctomycetota bacterium]|jgi:multidrug efflux pump subunit AcrA (membrane-fusion protein)
MTSSTDQVQQLVQNALKEFEQLVQSQDPPSEVLARLVQTIARATDAMGAITWMPTDSTMQAFTAMAKIGDGAALAFSPDAQPLPQTLQIIHRAIQGAKAVVVTPEQDEFAGTPLHGATQFYVHIQAVGRILGVIHVIVSPQVDPTAYRQYATFIQQGAQAVGAYLIQRQSRILKEDFDGQGQLLAITRLLLKLDKPQDVLHELATLARPLLEAQRVGAISYCRSNPESAFSDTLDTNRKAVVVRAYEMLAEAVVQRQTPMTFVKGQPLEGEDQALEPLLNQLFELGNAESVGMTPVRYDKDIVGVLIAEFETPETASRHAATQQELALQAGAILKHATDAHQRPLRRTSNLISAAVRHPVASLVKTAIALGLIAAAIWGLFFVQVPMPIRGDARLEPSRMAMVTAPYPGLVHEIHVHTNDLVKAGQPLAQLEDTELRLSYAEEDLANQAETVSANEALRQGDSPAVLSSNLKIEQGELRKQSLQRMIDRSQITSPIDGIVLTENIEQLEGRTVTQGVTLLTVADLSRFDLIMEVAEHDLALIEQSLQHGPLPVTFLSRAWSDLPQRASISDIKSLAPTSTPNKDQNAHVYQITVDIELSGIDSQLFLANPTGRARIEAQPVSVVYRYGRGVWRFIQMMLF